MIADDAAEECLLGFAAVVFKGHLHRLAEAHTALAALLGEAGAAKALVGEAGAAKALPRGRPAPRKRQSKVPAAPARKRRRG